MALAVQEVAARSSAGRSIGARSTRWVRRQPVATVSGLFLMGTLAVAILAPVVAPYSPLALIGPRLASPSRTFLLGTDSIGRDVLSQVIYGARISMLVGFGSVGTAAVFGAVLGIVSGFSGSWVDMLIQRLMDALMSFPTLLAALMLATVLGPSTRNSILAIGISILPFQARVVRSEVLWVKEQAYVEAARSLGAGDLRLMWRAILPNVMPLIITLATLQLAGAIVAEAALSFLGLGTPPPTPSWGEMLSGPGQTYMASAPWIALAPGIALVLTVLAFNMLGDGLRDILDPRQRGAS